MKISLKKMTQDNSDWVELQGHVATLMNFQMCIS
jgi:hypothetical protein